jgi:hypothetical protein
METAAKEFAHQQRKQQKQQPATKKSLLQQKQKKERGIIRVDLNDPDQVQPLLDAKVQLISLDIDRDQMNEVSEDTYQGITAEFCKLDFEIQKKDPSSGEYSNAIFLFLS